MSNRPYTIPNLKSASEDEYVPRAVRSVGLADILRLQASCVMHAVICVRSQ